MSAVSFQLTLPALAGGIKSAVRSTRDLSGAAAKRSHAAARPSPITAVFNGTGGA